MSFFLYSLCGKWIREYSFYIPCSKNYNTQHYLTKPLKQTNKKQNLSKSRPIQFIHNPHSTHSSLNQSDKLNVYPLFPPASTLRYVLFYSVKDPSLTDPHNHTLSPCNTHPHITCYHSELTLNHTLPITSNHGTQISNMIMPPHHTPSRNNTLTCECQNAGHKTPHKHTLQPV